MSTSRLVALVCAAALATAVPLVSSVPMQQPQQPQQQQQQQQQDDGAGAPYASVFWSVLDDCFGGEDVVKSAAVCLKSKALTALDRALSKPTVAVADGVSLAARTGRSLQLDERTGAADRAALDAAKDADHKNALLDDLLADRIDALVSTRTIVMDAPAGQEGRGKKKDKTMKQAMMMMGMMGAAIMGPLMMKMMSLIAIKALVVSKIALVLSIIMVVKKLMSQKQGGGGGGGGGGGSSHSSYEAEPAPYARSMQLDAHDMAYSGQKQ